MRFLCHAKPGSGKQKRWPAENSALADGAASNFRLANPRGGRTLGPVSLQVVVDFQVIDECDDWIVVAKPAPLIVHPANRKPEPTLLGGIEMLLSYEMENGACPGIVTRLDRETSGLVLVAKHASAARELGGVFTRREATKEYLAVVHGWPAADDWICEAPILRAGDLGPTPIWVRQMVHPDGKVCRTRFAVTTRFERAEGRFALVRCFPETGRMHQLRVHLAHSGHPIVGDKLYSGSGAEYLEWMATGWTPALGRRLFLPRHALHAAVLAVPWQGRRIEWRAELATDLRGFVAGDPVTDIANAVLWSRHDSPRAGGSSNGGISCRASLGHPLPQPD
jgi:23S rRNA pseudouridine1911/1915/1917 synthase